MQLLSLIVIAGHLLLARSLIYDDMYPRSAYKEAVPEYVEDKLLSVGIVVYEDYNSIASTVGKNFNIGDYLPTKGNTLCDHNLVNTASIYSSGTGFITGPNE